MGAPESSWQSGQRQDSDRRDNDGQSSERPIGDTRTAFAAFGGGAHGRRHRLLPVLHAIQKRIGWISPGALNYVALRLDVAPAEAPRIWDALLAAGEEFGIKPAGLGARNTLRLEAAMALYGHEIHSTITPWEANLDWIVKLDKGDFVGRDALVKQKERTITRKLIGFEMQERGIGRDGYEVYLGGSAAGWVTSGGPAPTLNKNIGFCYLPASQCEIGRVIQVIVRNQPVAAMTVPTPFYKRAK